MKLTVGGGTLFFRVHADEHQVGRLVRFSKGWEFVCRHEEVHWVMSPSQLKEVTEFGRVQATLLNITERLKS